MTKYLFALAFLALASIVQAQTPIVIGPNSLLVWDVPGVSAVTASTCTYAVSPAGAPFVPIQGQVTCVAPVAPATAPSCSVNLMAQTSITIGSGSLVMTTTCQGLTSLPSAPFQYLDLVVPVPTNVRFK